MRVYCAVYARGLRRYATYRAATAAGVFTNSVFGAINAMVLALFTARPEINGYDATDAVTQVYVAQALLAPLAIMGPALDLSERIRSGAVGIDRAPPGPGSRVVAGPGPGPGHLRLPLPQRAHLRDRRAPPWFQLLVAFPCSSAEPADPRCPPPDSPGG